MASSDVRRKILVHLKELAPTSSIQPVELASAVGLTTNQVNPSLVAATKRGEVETLHDGSVRVTSVGRGRLRDGKLIGLSALPDSVGVPLGILNQAIAQVPVVRYALGVVGIAAAASIIYVLLNSWVVGFIVILVLLLFMVLLYIFAKLVEVGGWVVQLAGFVLMWFVLLLFMATCVMLFSSAFFHWPLDFRSFYPSQPEPDSLRRPSLGWYSGLAPLTYHSKPEFSGIPFEVDEAQQMPRYLSDTDFQDVRDRQKQNRGGGTPPFYYLFATRTLQEYELPPKRIGFRGETQAVLVVYVQESVDGWKPYPAQGRITSAKQLIELPDRSKERRKHVVVLVVFPFDLSSFRKGLDENHWNIDGLLEVQFEP